jgi:hypothetical protein
VPAQTPLALACCPACPASPRKVPNPMIRKKFYFDDMFADILLVHILNHATFKGAEIGECLAAAAKVAEGNAESWRRAWQEQGEKAEQVGRQADDRGRGVSAREAYLRAVTYYYHACLAIPVDDPAYRAGVEHYRAEHTSDRGHRHSLPGHPPACVFPAAGRRRRGAPHGRHR